MKPDRSEVQFSGCLASVLLPIAAVAVVALLVRWWG